MSDASWDAVVVGAGPAGSATAARLARRGHHVLLLDRAEFPRRKPCGECLNPAAVAALGDLGVRDAVEAAAHAALEGWRIVAGDEHFEASFPPDRIGLAIPRERLDWILAEHARGCGAELLTGAWVRGLMREGEQVTGVRVEVGGESRELRARVVVGADGLRSVVLRRLGLLARGPRLRKVALTAHLTGMVQLRGKGELRVWPGGCLGMAEVGDGIANVTLVVTRASARAARRDVTDYFDSALRGLGVRGERVDAVLATGPFDWPVRSAVAPGALLVGDAAGYFDPFTGQGIFRALRGAELAADVLHDALVQGECSVAALAPYERARRRAFSSGERLQRAVELLVSRPRLMRWAVRGLRAHPSAGDAIIRVAGDLQPVRSLLHAFLFPWRAA